jgi:hypothetical protein
MVSKANNSILKKIKIQNVKIKIQNEEDQKYFACRLKEQTNRKIL